MTTADSPFSKLMLALEEFGGIDPLVSSVQPVLQLVGSNKALLGALQGKWLGHALHPLVVGLPIGTWASAALLDVAGADEDAADLLVLAGILSAVPSACTGLAELVGTKQKVQRVGVAHALSNVGGLGLQVASLAARRKGNTASGKALSAAAMGLVGVAGYLGGHLAVAREVGTRDRVFEQQPA